MEINTYTREDLKQFKVTSQGSKRGTNLGLNLAEGRK